MRLEAKTWQEMLPVAFSWVEKVAVQSVTAEVTDAWHIVPVIKDGNAMKALTTAASKVSIDAWLDAAKELGWQAQSGSIRVSAHGHRAVLVAVTSLIVTHAQKSRQLGLEAGKALKDCGNKPIVWCHAVDIDTFAGLEGLAHSFYDLASSRGQVEKKDLPPSIGIWGEDADRNRLMEWRVFVQAGLLTRHLQDLPANILTPVRFAEIAEGLFKGSSVKVKIHGPKQLKEFGMGAFLAVAQGSVTEPRMIEIDIPGNNQEQTIALVGKGLTFDSGGISIKGSAGMGEMKFDMSGGAAVLGAAWFLQKVKPALRTVCLIGAVENMPSGSAIRPGDIVQTMNGKTVEILNTDAEGRLVLCDVLTYAQRHFKPTLVADIATLTGAVLQGLGHAGAAYLTHNEKTAKLVYEIGQLYGEPLWRLPLWPELAKEAKSETADLANIPKPNVAAGTIMGAVYLREFIEQAETEWVHLDIAGTAWACTATGYPEGSGSAFGLRTLIGLAMRYTV